MEVLGRFLTPAAVNRLPLQLLQWIGGPAICLSVDDCRENKTRGFASLSFLRFAFFFLLVRPSQTRETGVNSGNYLEGTRMVLIYGFKASARKARSCGGNRPLGRPGGGVLRVVGSNRLEVNAERPELPI